MGAAGILENGDLRGRAARATAGARKIIEVAQNLLFAEDSGLQRNGNVGDVHRRFPAIDKDAADADAIVVRLAGVEVVAADKVEMCAGLEPAPANERRIGT